MNAIEKKSFQLRSASVFYNLPPPPPLSSTLFYAWRGSLWISNGYLKIWISGFQITVIGVRWCTPPQKWNAHFWIMFNLWWLAKWSEWWKSTEMQKKVPKSLKDEMLIFGLRSTSDDWMSDLSYESWLKCKKGPPSHRKMKCSFLDYMQLLMIGRVIE